MTRYGLFGIATDILEVRQLAARGGCGPVGPDGKVMTWSNGQWVRESE